MGTDGAEERLLSRSTAREMVAIILSILIAFAIDAGWDARQERLRETEILSDLVGEAETNLADLEDVTARQRVRAERLEILLADLEEPRSVIGVDSLRGLRQVYFSSSFRPRTGVMRELIASGDMRVLRDRELRKRIAGFDEAIGTYIGNTRSIQERFLDPTRAQPRPMHWAERPLSPHTREVANYLRWVLGITRLLIAQSEGVADELRTIRTLAGGT